MATATPEHKELKAKWEDEVTVKAFSKQEVAKHNTKRDLWVIIHGKVYNLTEYVRDHPGGPDTLIDVAGKDATGDFEDVGHSEDAREILHGFLVGVLEGAEPESATQSVTSNSATAQVVRKQPASEPASTPSNNLFAPGVELAALALGTAGLVLAANRLHLISLPFSSASGQAASVPHWDHGKFAVGFLLATVSAGAVAVMGLRYFESVMSFNNGFAQYPAHLPGVVKKRPAYHPAGVLLPSQYQNFRLSRKEELSPGIYRFVFDLPTKHSVLGLPIGQHVAIQASINGHTVVRSYTPVSNNRDLGRLELLIRVYPDGQLGNYLKSLNVGDFAEVRGPKGAMKYKKGICKSIGMIAGGTGITPVYQLIRAICEDPTDTTHVSLIYANRSEEDIMLRQRLDSFAQKASSKFSVYYILDNPPAGWKGGAGRVSKDLLAEKMPKPDKDAKILLCGPPPMINATKKNLVDLGFEAPGAVGKMADQIFCF